MFIFNQFHLLSSAFTFQPCENPARTEEMIKSSASCLYLGPQAVVPAPAVARDHHDLSRRDERAHGAVDYRGEDICVSGRDRKGIGSQGIHGRDRVYLRVS
jgi:hypothetical protein